MPPRRSGVADPKCAASAPSTKTEPWRQLGGSSIVAAGDAPPAGIVSSAAVHSSGAPGGGYVDAVLTAPPASATEIAHSEAQRMLGEQAKPAEQPSTVITPPSTQSRPQLDDEKERLRLERDAARRELEALKAQLAAQAPQSA